MKDLLLRVESGEKIHSVHVQRHIFISIHIFQDLVLVLKTDVIVEPLWVILGTN